ncbi:hypothetical protein EAH80_27845 [Mycobacterium hodleri]|uniref:Uncharacterized protein n=1 Tax=Mycolicibacterium hodleri TaxID=49897 RepID=A0A502DV93_9MYCO|nr:hypothetical protein EAH80_27845 [Mycolicibacterium hodleri]
MRWGERIRRSSRTDRVQARGGWDAAGASGQGFRTFWVNRIDSPAERLGVDPKGSGAELNDLVEFIDQRR